jgi:hypothetical protein
MRLPTAIKRIDTIVAKHIRSELAFDANLHKRGMVKSHRTEKAAKEMDKLLEAWEMIKNEVLGEEGN